MSPGQRLRAILARDTTTPAAPIFDPLSARIAELADWEVTKLSGSAMKFASLAIPDEVALANPSDLVDVCRRITRVSDVPLIADGDDGGGNALNVLRTVRELEAAGVAGIELDDGRVPSRFADDPAAAPVGAMHVMRESGLISTAEQVGKLRAAVAARRNPDTVIVARTDALTELPLPEALERITAYSATGAEAIMFPWIKLDRDAFAAVSRATPLRICLLRVDSDLDAEFLTAHRVRLRFVKQIAYAMAVRVMYDAYTHLKAGLPAAALDERSASAQLLRAVDRTAELKAWQRDYVRD